MHALSHGLQPGTLARVPMRTRLRSLAPAAILAFAALAVAPVATSAGPTFTFSLAIGGDCATGTGPANTSILLTLRDPAGNVIDSEVVESDGVGAWSQVECFWYNFDGGDRIRADAGPSHRTLRIPNIDFAVNRVTDVVHGTAPTAGAFRLYASDCDLQTCTPGPDRGVTVQSDGTFSKDLTSAIDLDGYDNVYGRWTSPAGDTVTSMTHRVPYIWITINDPYANGQANPGLALKATLKSGSTVLGTLSAFTTHRRLYWNSDFETSSGHAAFPKPGNRVTANYASDANIIIPDITLSHDATSVSGHCFPNAFVYVYLEHYNPYAWTQGYTTSNGSGNFSLPISAMNNTLYTFGSHDRWEVDCLSGKGDGVSRYEHFSS